MRSGSVLINVAPRRRRLRGLGTTEAEAQSRIGTPKQPGEWITPYEGVAGTSSSSLWRCDSWGHKRACEIGQPGMEGACRPCGTPFGVPARPPTTTPPTTVTYPDYALADRQIKRMIDNVQTCQIPSTSVVPQSLTLAPPDGNAPASVIAAYDSYSLRLAELEQAKRTATSYCSAGTNPGSGPGVQYGTPSCGFDAYGRQLPCGQYRQTPTSAISAQEVDLYPSDPVAADIYTRDVATQRNYPEGGTDIVTNPYAPQPPPAAPPPKKKPKAAIFAAGGVALLAVALLARKRGSRSRGRR